MSIKQSIGAVLVMAFGSISQLRAEGYIIPNGVITNFITGEISVMYNPINQWYTGFILRPQANITTFQFIPVLDVGVRVFFVSLNDPITAQSISTQSYTELQCCNSYTFDLQKPFYVGLYTGNQQYAPMDGIYSDPLFGWARLVNINGSIRVIDSALEYQGGGIIAGTQTILPVPEPSTFAFAGIGALMVGFWRCLMRRKHKAATPGE